LSLAFNSQSLDLIVQRFQIGLRNLLFYNFIRPFIQLEECVAWSAPNYVIISS